MYLSVYVYLFHSLIWFCVLIRLMILLEILTILLLRTHYIHSMHWAAVLLLPLMPQETWNHFRDQTENYTKQTVCTHTIAARSTLCVCCHNSCIASANTHSTQHTLCIVILIIVIIIAITSTIIIVDSVCMCMCVWVVLLLWLFVISDNMSLRTN